MRDCDYCHHENPETDHRCQRCGRRLPGAEFQAAAYRSAPAPIMSRSSAVPQLRTADPESVPPPPPSGLPAGRPVQKALFESQVVRLDEYDPSLRRRRARSRPARRSPSRRAVSPDQQAFDFLASASPAQPAGAAAIEAEPVRCCDQPVATIVDRLAAAGADMGIVLVAMAPVLAALYYWGGGFGLAAPAFGLLAGSFAAVLILYKLLWSLGNGNTPGASWRGLELLDFDGRPATRDQRTRRLSSEILSCAALGLGVIWALADREKLTWHDHISRTFLSPRSQ